MKQPDTEELCRRCGKESETIQHITAACEKLAPTEYVKRHDGLAKIIHQKLAEAAGLIDDKRLYYKYTPANVLENESFKLYWNRSILTDKTVPFNRPDITFMNKNTKNTFLIDIAVPNRHNLAKAITDGDDDDDDNNNNNMEKSVLRARHFKSVVEHSLQKDTSAVSPQSQSISVVIGAVEEENLNSDLQQSRDIIKHLIKSWLLAVNFRVYSLPCKEMRHYGGMFISVLL